MGQNSVCPYVGQSVCRPYKWFEGRLKGSDDQLEGSKGQLEGSEGLLEGSEGLP